MPPFFLKRQKRKVKYYLDLPPFILKKILLISFRIQGGKKGDRYKFCFIQNYFQFLLYLSFFRSEDTRTYEKQHRSQ